MAHQSNKVYFNTAQRKVMAIRANSSTIIAARGIGKSEGIDAYQLADNAILMPRMLGGIVTPTYTKLLRNTLPAICHGLTRLGFRKHTSSSPGHYVVGHTPPKWFKRPYIEPATYDNCMVFFNGSCYQFISQDGVMSANSMSLDCVLGFEAKFLNKSKIDSEVTPANRGNRQYFGNCWKHHGVHYTSDRPTLDDGLWLFDEKKNMDESILSAVVDDYDDIQRLKVRLLNTEDNSATAKYIETEIKNKKKELNLFRQHLYYYDEFDSIENLDVLGIDWFFRMKKVLPPYMFLTSIMNLDVRQVTNCFYPFLNESHQYVPDNSEYMLSQGIDAVDRASLPKEYSSCTADGDIRYDLPLILSLDYNSSINNLVISQVVDNTHRTINTLFVKTPKKLDDLMVLFCKYYEPFVSRNFVYYYDSTAVWETASQSEKYYETVLRVLNAHGWNGISINLGNPERHDVKYQVFAEAFSDNPEYLTPAFNKFNCEELLLAMKHAKTRVTRNGFEKDKSLEKKEDSQEYPDELKTHITDAWDTNYLGCLNYPYSSYSMQGGLYIP